MSPRPRFGPRREDPFAWLSLVLTEGPFLSRPALKAQYAQGLPRPDSSVDEVGHAFRDGFTAWERAWTAWVQTKHSDGARDRYLAQRDQWVQTMVRSVLEWDRYFQPRGAGIRAASFDGQVTVEPLGILATADVPEALLLVVEPTDDLAAPGIDGWTASAIDRGAALLRAANDHATTKMAIAVVTDGRWWSLVWTSDQGSVGSGTFDGALFREEPDLRDAFWSLARLTSLAGGAPERRLPALLAASVASAEEITDALGRQVRAAVELLVQSFSESHVRALESGAVSPLPADGHQAYEAAVTVMMRVIFLLFAEANELLPEGDLFHEAYAISGVGDRLDERRRQAIGVEGEELLEGSFDTWHRMLATSRALYEGATFEDLRMPAYGGSLFDPDRFNWMAATDATTGRLRLLVDDRVMWHVLRAVEHVIVSGEDRTVSFRELDVEQIGYVYEGLLGYSARFTSADEIIVGLDGPDDGSEPEIPLEDLHGLAEGAGEDGKEFAKLLLEWVKKHQPGAKGRTVLQIAKAYDASGNAETQDDAQRLLRPVVREKLLIDQLVGYIELIRRDLRGLPYVVPAGGLVVVETRSRATSGTHYTPRFLAEEVALHALEPLVFSPGPLQTADTNDWVPISSSQILELKVADIAVGSGAFLVAAARYLGRKLLEAWDREGITGEDGTGDRRKRREIEARREIIAHCLYGADINSMAVEMCKLSLWLVSLDPLRPFSFVDDKIFCGNSLLGLTEVRQLRGLHVDPSSQRLTNPGFTVDVDGMLERSTELRHQLTSTVSESDAMRSIRGKRALLAQLDANNRELRDIADGIIAAGLSLGGKPGKVLEQSYESLSVAFLDAYQATGASHRATLDGILDRGLTPMVETDWSHWKPLHWVIEVPDVMLENGGFDAVIGNPPFLDSRKISGAVGKNVRDWLVERVAFGRSGTADLAAYFFLRVLVLANSHSASFGLLATNTIAQGDTREVGLEQIIEHGWVIRRAVQSAKWPSSSASLHYAAVWATADPPLTAARIISDGMEVKEISSYLEAKGGSGWSVRRLPENKGGASIGSNINGAGFVMEPNRAASMLEADHRNSDVLFPFLGGDDLNGSPTGTASRWVVNFGTMTEDQAATYSQPWAWLDSQLRPYRIGLKNKPTLARQWWVYERRAVNLYESIHSLDEVLAIVLHSKPVMPVRVPSRQVFSHGLCVFATDDYADQAVLSSSLHQAWAIAYGSTLETRVRYTPTDVFETFPRPVRTAELDSAGRNLDTRRGEMMFRRDLGLTELYNLVNDPGVTTDDDVNSLRQVHVAVDAAVLASYGWGDVHTSHGFHTYRQMERFTISPSARNELFGRLIEENRRRYNLGVNTPANADPHRLRES